METLSGIQRNLVKEILRECFPNKLAPNESFVAFYVKLLLLDPNWGITDNYINTRINIQKFVAHFIAELIKENLRFSTLEMQFSFSCYLETIPQQIQSNSRQLLKHLDLLKIDICKSPEPKDENELYLLNKKIVYFVTLFTGLGPPTKSLVIAEVLAALKSILDDNELREFTKLSKHKKEVQLLHMSKIISGIRLFNKDCGKGGNGIPKLPALLDSAVARVKAILEKTLLHVMGKVNLLTTFVGNSYDVELDIRYSMVRKNEIPADILFQAKELLILFRQYELSVRKLIEELNILQEENETIYNRFKVLLSQIHKTVQFRIAVSVSEVYPLFTKLANLWTKMQNQVIKLTVFKNIMRTLDEFITNADVKKIFNDMTALPVKIVPISDAERLECTASYTLTSKNPQLSVLNAEIVNIDGIKIEYLGFCPWKLVQTEGALIPGNPSMGVVKFKNLYFVFSCPEAFTEFSKEPEEFVMRVLTLARKMPHLIVFLDIRDQLEEVIDQYQLVKIKVFEKKTRDNGIQTCKNYEEVVAPSKEKRYKWNVWDLKREALKLADCYKCKTVSSQTNKTHSKVGIGTQTHTKETQGTQTKIDNYTNVMTPSTFIFGLRGQTGDNQMVLDVTLPRTF